MRKLIESDLFLNQFNKGNAILGKVNAILSGVEKETYILNEILYGEIKKKIIDKRKDKISAEFGNAIMDGRIILFTLPPEKRLTDVVPFFVYKQNGIRKVAINLSNIIVPKKTDTGDIEFELGDNVNEVYVLLHTAYITLEKLDEKSVLSPSVMYNSAVVWADMFNKPWFDAIGLNNRDRTDAFMYFAMKFFLVYFLDCKEQIAESIAMKYLETGKNDLILYMEEQIAFKELDIYSGMLPFISMLLNDEVTSIKGIRVNTISKAMNVSFYIMRFTQTYGSNALLSLCAYPYFVYTITAAMSKTRMVKYKSFERLFSDNQKTVNKLLVELMRD